MRSFLRGENLRRDTYQRASSVNAPGSDGGLSEGPHDAPCAAKMCRRFFGNSPAGTPILRAVSGFRRIPFGKLPAASYESGASYVTGTPRRSNPHCPARAYWDAEFFARERRAIFGTQWTYVGARRRRIGNAARTACSTWAAKASSSCAATTGSCTRTSISAVIAAAGCCAASGVVRGAIRCPYHAWAYAHDGRSSRRRSWTPGRSPTDATAAALRRSRNLGRLRLPPPRSRAPNLWRRSSATFSAGFRVIRSPRCVPPVRSCTTSALIGRCCSRTTTSAITVRVSIPNSAVLCRRSNSTEAPGSIGSAGSHIATVPSLSRPRARRTAHRFPASTKTNAPATKAN